MATQLLFIGTTELLLVGGLALLLFGGKKLPEMMRGLGQGVKEFKKCGKDVEENVKDEGSEQTDKDPEVTNSRTESKLTTHSSKEEGTE